MSHNSSNPAQAFLVLALIFIGIVAVEVMRVAQVDFQTGVALTLQGGAVALGYALWRYLDPSEFTVWPLFAAGAVWALWPALEYHAIQANYLLEFTPVADWPWYLTPWGKRLILFGIIGAGYLADHQITARR